VPHAPYLWWPLAEPNPPASWAYVFEELTSEETADQWGLAAAIFIAQTRHRTGQGPTFLELFLHLLPDLNGLPADFPSDIEYLDRRRVVQAFRGHAAIEWRRRGLISWERNVMRSLRVGRAFREQSRQRRVLRASSGNR
jgi:hypothetical protein